MFEALEKRLQQEATTQTRAYYVTLAWDAMRSSVYRHGVEAEWSTIMGPALEALADAAAKKIVQSVKTDATTAAINTVKNAISGDAK